MKPVATVNPESLLNPVAIEHPHPPARAAMLADVDRRVLAMLTTPYGAVAHICDAVLTERVVGVVVTPGWTHGRAWIVQSSTHVAGDPAPAQLATQSGGESGANLIPVASPLAQVAPQLEVGFGLAAGLVAATSTSSAVVDDTPAAAKDRALELTAALAAATERVRVTGACGFTVFALRPIDDLQSLE